MPKRPQNPMSFETLCQRAMRYPFFGSRPRGFQLDDLRQYLDEGGDPNQKDDNGQSLLNMLADEGNIPAIELVVSRGADLRTQDVQGWTPLHFAVDCDCDSSDANLSATKALLGLGADESAKTAGGETPRDIALGYGEKAAALYDALPRPQKTLNT